MRAFALAGVALLLFSGCRGETESAMGPAAPPLQPPSALGSWLARADYPTDIWQAASVSITDPATLSTTVYVIGGMPRRGSGAGNLTDAVRAYDVKQNAWRRRAAYPVRIRGTNGAVEIEGKIYVSGGQTRRWDEQRGVWRPQWLRSLFVYDPALDRWTRKRDMPLETVNGLSAAYRGQLYVATFCDGTAPCGGDWQHGAIWRYSPSTDRWVLLTRTPHSFWSDGGGFIGGKLHLVEALGSMHIYDLATDTWSTGPQRPVRFCSPASATLQGRLYLVGCYDDFDDSGVYPMLVYDPRQGSWSEAAAPPVAAYGAAWALARTVVDGRPRLELIGGARPGNNWQFVP